MSEATGTARVKRGMAEMLKGGVIMDVVTPEQAKIAEDAGACAVMALERIPAEIRKAGGVARMSDPDMIDEIIANNEKSVLEFKSGKEKALNALVGQAMKVSKGQANPAQLTAMFKEKLAS